MATFSIDRPQWGSAIADAFRQGSASVENALAERRRREDEEEERLRAEAYRRALFQAENPQFTNDPTRKAVVAPTAVLPTQVRPGAAGSAQDGPVPSLAVPIGSRTVSGVSRAVGKEAPVGALGEQVRDMGDEFASQFGVRFMDPTRTPQYQQELEALRAQAAPMMGYTSRNVPVSGLSRAEALAAAAEGGANKETIRRFEDLATQIALTQDARRGNLAEMGVVDPNAYQLDLPDHTPDVVRSALGDVDPFLAMAGIANTRYNDDLNLKKRQVAAEEARVRVAQQAAQGRTRGKIDPQLALTIQNAREANARLAESGAPGWGSAFGETIGGILGVGALDPALRRSFKGQDARSIEADSNAFTEGFLRKMTGAAISETEFQRYASMFVPVVGDSKTDVQLKNERRENLLSAMEQMHAMGYSQAEIEASLQRDAQQAVSGSDATNRTMFDGAQGGSYDPLFPDNDWVGR